MTVNFPVVVAFLGAVANFALTAKLRRFKVSPKPPASRAGLSLEERQQKIRTASWISFALGWFLLAGAVFLAWMANST